MHDLFNKNSRLTGRTWTIHDNNDRLCEFNYTFLVPMHKFGVELF